MTQSDTPKVRLESGARAALEEHCFSRVDVEVGGFLLGTIDGVDVRVTAAHPALAAESAQTHLTITHEAWDEILGSLDSRYPGLVIVGWYHSHPGFGIFLSDYDIFIQHNFFSAPGQFALVVDPLIGRYGMFTATSDTATLFDDGDTGLPAVAAGDGGSASEARVAMLTQQPSRRRSRALPVVITAIIVAVLVGAAAWIIGTMQGSDAARTTAAEQIQRLQEQLDAALTPSLAPSPEPSVVAPSPEPSTAPSPSVPAGPTPGQQVSVQATVLVRPGDSWWLIAQRYLGAGTRYQEVIDANPGVRSLEPGMSINVPILGTLTQGQASQ